MSPKEGIYYAVWMGTIICTVLICRQFGVNRFVGLIGGVAIGYGLGSLAESLFSKHFGSGNLSSGSSPKKSDNPYARGARNPQVMEPGDVACSNPNCHWVGPSREHFHCPKCKQPIR